MKGAAWRPPTTRKSSSSGTSPAGSRPLPGVEVLAVELQSPSRFCVYIDHAEGVDHALCERVTNVLRDYSDRYTIDVSSRARSPLRKPGHFRNAVGHKVAVRTAQPVAGRKSFRGELVAAGPKTLTVAADPTPSTFPMTPSCAAT